MSKSYFWGGCLGLVICLRPATPLRAQADGRFGSNIAEAVRLYVGEAGPRRVSGVGPVLGLLSRGWLEDVQAAQLRDDRDGLQKHHEQAQRSARTANILFRAAGAAAGVLVTWLFMGHSEAPMAEGGAR